ncbi:MAG: hypothetical protein ABI432_14630 [Flavobacteriales bacterium]
MNYFGNESGSFFGCRGVWNQIMNPTIQSWFEQGNAPEALCGDSHYFLPSVTYRENHDFIFVVGELLEWSSRGNQVEAAEALDTALAELLKLGEIEKALRLLSSYLILRKEMRVVLPVDEILLATRLAQSTNDASERLSQDAQLRDLLISVAHDFLPLKKAIGLV